MTKPVCRACDGDGTVLLMKSWFLGDGFRRERCGWCGGSGSARGYPESSQRRFKSAEAAMASYRREHPKADLAELGRVAQAAMDPRP